MACSTILDAFAFATENLDTHLYEQASHRSIWLNLIRRGTYPQGVGTLRTVFGIGQIEPTAEDTWTTITSTTHAITSGGDGTDNACYDNYKDVEWGFYEKDYSPEIAQLRGPVVCVKDLSFAHNINDFIASYVHKLGIRAQRVWERRYQNIHIQFSKKAVAIPDFQSSWKDQEDLGGTTALDTATCELSQEMLEFVAQALIEDGATNPDSNGFISWGPNGPIFSLYIGMHQSQRIARVNSDIRADYRDAFSGFGEESVLIKRIGASRIVGNFRHVINPLPPRYSLAQGVYTEILPYANDADVTAGTAQEINVNWRNALYEAALVLSPELYVSEIVQPNNGGLNFDARSYMGEWKFVTGAYKWDNDSSCDDPLDQRGRHFAEFLHAAKPNPVGIYRLGWWIVFKRCLGNKVECVTCSS